MAGMYKRCPNCGADDYTWMVFRCENHHLYCTSCADQAGGFLGIGQHSVCPVCGGECEKYVGQIYPDEENGDDDD